MFPSPHATLTKKTIILMIYYAHMNTNFHSIRLIYLVHSFHFVFYDSFYQVSPRYLENKRLSKNASRTNGHEIDTIKKLEKIDVQISVERNIFSSLNWLNGVLT